MSVCGRLVPTHQAISTIQALSTWEDDVEAPPREGSGSVLTDPPPLQA